MRFTINIFPIHTKSYKNVFPNHTIQYLHYLNQHTLIIILPIPTLPIQINFNPIFLTKKDQPNQLSRYSKQKNRILIFLQK